MKFKRILASVMAMAMVASSLLVSPVNTDAADTTDTVDLADGLVGEYLFNGNWEDEVTDLVATPVDVYGADVHEGTADDADPVLSEDATRGNVAELMGTWNRSGYLQLNNSYVKDVEEGFTVSMWVKAGNSKATSYPDVDANLYNVHNDMTFFNVQLGGGYAALVECTHTPWINDASGNWVDRTVTENQVPTTEWVNVTVTLDPTANTILTYVNGELKTTTSALGGGTVAGLLTTINNATDAEIQIGNITPWWNTGLWATRGYVDDLRMYNRVLSAEEVAAIMDVEADTTVVPPALGTQDNPDTLANGSTEITVAAGETYYFYHLPADGVGEYTVKVTGATGFTVRMYDVPMYPMPSQYQDADGEVAKNISTSMFAQEIQFMVTNNTDTAQTYAVSVAPATPSGGEGGEGGTTEGDGSQENPYTLSLTETNLSNAKEGWGDYFKFTATEAGTLKLVLNEEKTTIEGARLDALHVATGSWEGYATSLEVTVAAGEEIVIEASASTYGEGVVAFDATFTAGTGSDEGDEGDEGGEGSEGDDAAGTWDDPKTIIMGTNTSVHELYQYVYYTYTATENGTLYISMKDEESTNGWAFDGYYNDYEYFASALSSANEDSALTTVTLNAGDIVSMTVWTQDEGAGTVVFTAFFMEGEGRQEGKEEFVLSDTVLNLGDNSVTLDPNAETTGFEFTPDEVGTYKFEVTGDFLLGDWNASYYPLDMTVNKTNTLEATITSVGQSILVGVTGEGDCTIKVSKVEGTVTPEEPTKIEVMYENKFDPIEFELPEDAELVYVDVTDGKAETAVLGADGFYHLNTADGPILFVNIGYYAPYSKLMEAVGYGQVKVTVKNDDDSYTVTDFTDAINEYYETGDNGLCVLTEDLIHIFKVLGEDKGWYDPEKPLGFYLFTKEVVTDDESSFENIPCDENAWMFACAYVDAEAVTVEDQEWTQDSGKDVVITLDKEFANFGALYIDGKVVAAENYTVAEGSIILTLKAAYLDTLAAGPHTVEVLYKDATVTIFDLVVEEAEVDDPVIDTKGDVSNMVGYMVVLMGVALIVVAVSAKKRFA